MRNVFKPAACPKDRPQRGSSSLGVKIVALFWLGGIIAAMVVLTNYTHLPGHAGGSSPTWPLQSHIDRDPGRPTLVMFAHPHCPCTRATIGELDLLMAQSNGKLAATVVFIQPEGLPEEWVKGDLLRQASAIPGVRTVVDHEGMEVALFHAETSGYTLVYDSQGQLVFEGGITISRGHSGDNPGRRAIVALLEGKASGPVETPVFGCSLAGPARTESK
jgi:hypothetical protein